MQSVINFLTFKTFISPSMLILMYYFGVVVMPFLSWLLARWLFKKFDLLASIQQELKVGVKSLYQSLSTKNKILLISLLVSSFIMMEIIWRMMFETLLAYYQMRDYLQALSG